MAELRTAPEFAAFAGEGSSALRRFAIVSSRVTAMLWQFANYARNTLPPAIVALAGRCHLSDQQIGEISPGATKCPFNVRKMPFRS